MTTQTELKFITIKPAQADSGTSDERISSQLNELLADGYQMLSHQTFGGGARQYFVFGKLEE